MIPEYIENSVEAIRGWWAEVNAYAEAAGNGDNEAVITFLDKHPDAVNERNYNSWTAMMHAALGGHKDTVELLLERGSSFEGAIMFAARNGHNDVIELLLEKGADINEKPVTSYADWTALMEAVKNTQPETVEFLLLRGAGVDVRDKYGRAALDLVPTGYVSNEPARKKTEALLKEWPERKKKILAEKKRLACEEAARLEAEETADFSVKLKHPMSAPRRLKPFRKP